MGKWTGCDDEFVQLVRIGRNDPGVHTLCLYESIVDHMPAVLCALERNTTVTEVVIRCSTVNGDRDEIARKWYAINCVFNALAELHNVRSVHFINGAVNLEPGADALVRLIDASPHFCSLGIDYSRTVELRGFAPIYEAALRHPRFDSLRLCVVSLTDESFFYHMLRGLTAKGTMRRLMLCLGSYPEALLADGERVFVEFIRSNPLLEVFTFQGSSFPVHQTTLRLLEAFDQGRNRQSHLRRVFIRIRDQRPCTCPACHDAACTLVRRSFACVDMDTSQSDLYPLILANASVVRLFKRAPRLGDAQQTDSGGDLAELPNDVLCRVAELMWPSRALMELAWTCRLLRDVALCDYVALHRHGIYDWRAVPREACVDMLAKDPYYDLG